MMGSFDCDAPVDLATVSSSPRRTALNTVVSALCMEAGFDSIDKPSLETLTEALQSCLVELGRSMQSYCELAGRNEPIASDVILAAIEMGLKLQGLPEYAKRTGRITLLAPSKAYPTKQINILQAGSKKSHPGYIPDHLPPFPDPHAYIRTPTHKQPVTEYEAIREKAASQKRDVERALTRFIAKTGETQSLFMPEDNNIFPLIACKPLQNPYLGALLPKDQIFEEDDASIYKPRKKGKIPVDDDSKEKHERSFDQDNESIDNPYLRPAKVPKKSRRK